jgi:hypothetical protein
MSLYNLVTDNFKEYDFDTEYRLNIYITFLILKEFYMYRFHQTCLCFHIQNIYQYSIFFYWKKHSRGVIYILRQYSVSKSYILYMKAETCLMKAIHIKFF